MKGSDSFEKSIERVVYLLFIFLFFLSIFGGPNTKDKNVIEMENDILTMKLRIKALEIKCKK